MDAAEAELLELYRDGQQRQDGGADQHGDAAQHDLPSPA